MTVHKNQVNLRNTMAGVFSLLFGSIWLINSFVGFGGILDVAVAIIFFYIFYKIIFKGDELSRKEWYAVILLFLMGIIFPLSFQIGLLL